MSYLGANGHVFPKSDIEFEAATKLHSYIDFEELSKKIDAKEIWDADKSKEYSKEISLQPDFDKTIADSWAMAARGNANISKETLEKIKKNHQKKKGD